MCNVEKKKLKNVASVGAKTGPAVQVVLAKQRSTSNKKNTCRKKRLTLFICCKNSSLFPNTQTKRRCKANVCPYCFNLPNRES